MTSSPRTTTPAQPQGLAPDAGLDDLVEAIIAWTHAAAGTDAVVQASDRFHAENGKVFHDDSFYDTRTAYFFDHFVFERPLPGASGTPYELYLAHARAAQPPLAPELIDRLTWLGDFRHSLFQIVKLSEKSMVVQDLLTPGKVTVAAKPHETFRALDKKHLFQGFLFRVGEEHQLSSGLIIHPQKAGRAIRRFVKTGQKDGTFSRRTALAKLASLQLRHLRHRHVEPKSIYRFDSQS